MLPSYVALGQKSSSGLGPNDKVNVAVIGIGNQGDKNRKGFLQSGHCNIVALCDVDMEGRHTHEARYAHGLTQTPPKLADGESLPEVEPIKAKGYTDFRKMFDEMADEIDAVLIATPDHSHFAATMLAMSLGKHVYVQKPLAHTFGQCERMIRMADRSPNVVTQMGNQGHSGGNYFQFKTWREAGIIKDVTRITAYMNKSRRWHGWPLDKSYPNEPIPIGLDWDQWIDAVAAERPYSEDLHPGEWRSWFEFGSGAFGDWGPHILDTCHRFLELGLPEKITAELLEGINTNNLIYPQASTIRFSFPDRGGDLPPCEVTWYDGVDNKPKVEEELGALDSSTGQREPIKLNRPGKIIYSKDLVFQGDSHGSVLQILPRDKYMDIRRDLPRFPQKNSNHYTNFLLACKGEETVRSPFSVSGPLTQVFNLGVIAQQLGGEIRFDRNRKQFIDNELANKLLDPVPRKGWEEFYRL